MIPFFLVTAIATAAAFGSEGLFSINDLKTKPGYRNSYVEYKSCGGIRIHASKPYVLTALHCVTNEFDSIGAIKVTPMGNHFASDSINEFADLRGRKLKNGSKVVVAGRCFTGMDPEVLFEESKNMRVAAFKCALGDWAIVETPKLRATQCSPVTKSAQKELFALGATKDKTITRSVGLQKLNGNIYTRATVFSIDELIKDKNFAFASLWHDMAQDFNTTVSGKFQITDGDVMGGMSGGPLVNNKFELNAITTTALLAGNIWKYPGAFSFEDGFNFGIHGTILVSEIATQLVALKLKPENYFYCPVK